MRIALDARSVFAGMGGIGRSTAMLAEALPRVLPSAEIIFICGARRPERPLSSAKNTHVVETDAAMIDPVFEQFMLPGLLDEHDVDLLHGTCFSVPIPRSRAAYVATIHDVIFKRLPDLVEPRLRDYLDRATDVACELADAVVTVSEFSRREIAALYGRPADRIDVVSNAVERRFLEAKNEPKRDPPYFLYVGSIEPKKNIIPLLHGFLRFLQLSSGARHELHLAGSPGGGSSGLDVEAVLSEWPLLKDRVRILGHVPDADLPHLYANALGFVYLSGYEGFGLPPLEAMAVGVPTLVSDSSSLPEVTQGAALLVDPGSADAVGRALARLANDADLRRKLAKEGPNVASRTSIDKSARKLGAIYECAIARRRGQRLVGGTA